MRRTVSEAWVVHALTGTIVVVGLVAFPVVLTIAFDEAVPWFLWLLPVAGVAVAAYTLRTGLRSGFVVAPEGVSGTHDLGEETVPWSDVSAFEWEMHRSGSHDEHQRTTYRLVLVTAHARVRVTSIAASARAARRITATLSEARAEGAIPEHVEIHPPPTVGVLLRTVSGMLGRGR